MKGFTVRLPESEIAALKKALWRRGEKVGMGARRIKSPARRLAILPWFIIVRKDSPKAHTPYRAAMSPNSAFV